MLVLVVLVLVVLELRVLVLRVLVLRVLVLRCGSVLKPSAPLAPKHYHS